MIQKMKTNKYLLILTLALSLVGCGCSQDMISPEFDYNLKSAQVIETNNEFGLELLKTVLDAEDEPNVMISPASVSIANIPIN